MSYTVRRLTPTECARLQGFPDWWCRDLETENPTEEEISFWQDVFETHHRLVTQAKKPKTKKQIRKWLADPYRMPQSISSGAMCRTAVCLFCTVRHRLGGRIA